MAGRYLTAQEIAEAAAAQGVAGVPRTKQGVNALARREGWANLPATLARPRKGRAGGGGLEYHVSLLPEALRAALGHATDALATSRAVVVTTEEAGRQVALLEPAQLGARQRQVMEARGQILTAIVAHEAARGLSRSEAVAAFVGATALGEAALLEHFGVEAAVIRRANDRSGGDLRVGRSTLYGWFKAWQVGVGALAPKPPKAEQEISPAFLAFFDYFARPSKPSAEDALRKYMEDLVNPSMALTIDQVRYTLRHKFNNVDRHRGREGPLMLRARRAYVTRTFDHLWPADVYVADGHTFDAEVRDPQIAKAIRPEITSIIDVATRRMVGLAYSRKENTSAVTEALRRACLEHGIPAIFYTDNGAGYKNEAIDGETAGLMARLGIQKKHALPYGSQAKGVIERAQKTLWVTLAKRLPTYIGADMDKEAKSRVHKRTRADLAEIGASRILPSWEQFKALCEAELAAYNARPHSALPKLVDPETGKRRHMCPDEAWAAHVGRGWEPVLVEDSLKDDLFRHYERRKVDRGQVRWNNNEYFHPALEAYHEMAVLVGYDEDDATRVWVREMDRRTGEAGRLICVAEFGGNRKDFFPESAVDTARKKRARGRIARLEDQIAAVEAELDPLPLIEARQALEMPRLAPPEPSLVVAYPEPAAQAVPARPRRLTFDHDWQMAAWALQHPDRVSETQAGVLRKCLATDSGLAELRFNRIDPEAVRALLRARASTSPDQERRSA